MPREKEAFRDNLEMLFEAFDGKQIVTPTEVAHWMHRDIRTVNRELKAIIKPIGISIASLARYLS